MTTRILFLLLGLLFLLGCHENKMAGPEPTIPENATRLFVTDCDPFNHPPGYIDSVTLVADTRLACSGQVDFRYGVTATWTSNLFSAAPASYVEGARIVLNRPMSESQNEAIFRLAFHGVSVTFEDSLTIGVGRTQLIAEVTRTGTLTRDTTAAVSMTLTVLQGWATLELGGTGNSYVITEVSRNNLCELRIDQGLNGGVGRPNEGVTFTNANGTTAAWDSIYYDFTGGASLSGTALVFGPNYGPVYVIAGDGRCRDMASFWAPAAQQNYRVDTLGFYEAGNLVSDGTQVWHYDVYYPSHDSIPCGVFRVRWPSNIPLIEHPVYDCSTTMFAEFDQQNQKIWIVGRYAAQRDTAWAYSTTGHFLGYVTSDNMPYSHIYRGRWVTESSHNSIVSSMAVTLIGSDEAQPLGEYPTELTMDFAGAAGIGLPGSGRSDSTTINVFNARGAWVGAFPVLVGPNDVMSSIALLSADSIVVYSIAGIFESYGTVYGQQVRVLRPR
jgi:hypothetical protein